MRNFAQSHLLILFNVRLCRAFLIQSVDTTTSLLPVANFFERSSCFLRATTAPNDDPTLRSVQDSAASSCSALWGNDVEVDDLWTACSQKATPYRSTLLDTDEKWSAFLEILRQTANNQNSTALYPGRIRKIDPFWEQIKMEARADLEREPFAGSQLYQGILSQPSLMSAICTVVCNEIETELIPATALKNVFADLLTMEDEFIIRQDLQSVTMRSPSIEYASDAVLFHNGFHALVCYRVGHRLWQANRTGLAYYFQSTVSRKFSADIHPAAVLGSGIYMRAGAGIVIGETAVIGDDVSILEGVTLGGTGKEAGDRHPKVGNGVIIEDGGTVLGNIPVGEGAIVLAKSIVTKPVPPLAVVEGVPAKIVRYRDLKEEIALSDDLHKPLVKKYFARWRQLADEDSKTR
jgi:serine O-acetyltransferase